jgi:hypothetical protein
MTWQDEDFQILKKIQLSLVNINCSLNGISLILKDILWEFQKHD